MRVQTQRASFQQTQAALEEARDALLGFAAANGRLPCPAPRTPTAPALFGEAPAACPATLTRGLVPWRTLGIQGTDAWDQYLTYQVTQDFTTAISAATNANATAPRLLPVTGSLAPVVNDGTVAFVLWSQGANGHFAINVSNTQQPGIGGDEETNNPTNMQQNVIWRPASQAGSPLGEFDDVALWVSRFTLFKRLMDAGQNVPLPAAP